MSDNDLTLQISREDQADDIVDFDLVNGVFTRNAALLISRSYLISPQVVAGSEVPGRVDAFYIYYYDEYLEWMYAVDDSGTVRFVYTCCKRNLSTECEAEVDAVSYREAC
jgi:hypothetical protein